MLGLMATIAIIGIIVYFIQASPIPPLFKTAIYALACIWLVLIVVEALGGGGSIKAPMIRFG